MANPEVNYLTFGVGKQACPGRFFAVHQLKFLLSYTLLYYDIKYDEEDEEPKPSVFGGRVNLDAKTKMMFRKRGTPNM
ncbi:hypothetical protein MPER_12094 [Moniliophthora perniciosa FA553]|nr:hypothetical protein MPER_12094 [Moniliophthora perniciosa FA553]